MLENKVILITGASHGIGRAVAKALAAHGASLILLARTVSELQNVANEILQAGSPSVKIYPFNLCSATLEDYDDLRQNIANVYGRLDGLIHNAGILGMLAPIEHYTIQTWYQVLQVNLNSTFILSQATLPLLKQAQHASIIFTLTELSSNPKANWGAYAVASSGCLTLMQMLAAECANTSNIRVNAIKPAKVNTKLRAQAYPAEDHALLPNPDTIVDAYVHLMSDASRGSNGTIINAVAKEVEITEVADANH